MGSSGGEEHVGHRTATATPRNRPQDRSGLPPPIPSARRVPAPYDAAVGRSGDLAALRALIDSDDRVVTVLGPGGIGKTRLVMEWARDAALAASAPWCDLSEARSSDELDAVIRCALGMPRGAHDLARVLQARGPTLLVLDNAEQLEPTCSTFLGRLLRKAPQLRLLVTSRRPLAVSDERVLRLDPLPEVDGVALFCLRAQAAGVDFAQQDASRVPELVRRLDGLPLAIEITAARVRQLGMDAIIDRLDQRLDLLVRWRWQGTARHRSLEAALRWSWDLLDAEERSVLRQLAVFRGSFDLDSVRAIVDEPSAPAVLTRLKRHSLIATAPSGRYRLLASIRAFAEEQLDADPPTAHAARSRHARVFAERTRALRYFQPGPPAQTVIGEDRENLVAATEFALVAGEPDLAGRLVEALTLFAMQCAHIPSVLPLHERVLEAPGLQRAQRWRLVAQRVGCLKSIGRLKDAIQEADDALDDPSVQPDMRVSILVNRAGLARNAGQLAGARALLLDGLAIAEREADRYGECASAAMLSRLYIDDDEEAYAVRAVALATEVGAPQWEAYARVSLGIRWIGRPARSGQAAEQMRRAVELCQEHQLGAAEAANLNNLASVVIVHTGPFAEGVELLERSVALHRQGGNRAGEGLALGNLAMVYLALGRFEDAQVTVDASLELVAEFSAAQHGDLLRYRAVIEWESGLPARACRSMEASIGRSVERGSVIAEALARVQLASWRAEERGDAVLIDLDSALSLLDARGFQRHRAEALRYHAQVFMALGRLDDAAAALTEASERVERQGDRFGRAELQCVIADLAIRRGDGPAARAALERLDEEQRALGLGSGSVTGRRRAVLLARLDRLPAQARADALS